MAKGTKKTIEKEHSNVKLAEPFPAAPTRSSKHQLRFERNGNLVGLHLFAATYSAKKFLDAVLEDVDFKWRDANVIHTDMGVTIKSPDLEKIMEHEYSTAEKEWVLPDPYSNYARLLGSGKAKPVEKGTVTGRVTSDKPNHEEKPKRPAPPQPEARKGLVTIQDICKDLKLEPSKARQILRKAKEEKPAAGWAWSKKDAESIKNMLRKEMKK